MNQFDEDDNFVSITTKTMEEFILSIKPGGTPGEGDDIVPVDGKILREFFLALKPGKMPNTTDISLDRLIALAAHMLERVEAREKKKAEDAGRIAATGEES